MSKNKQIEVVFGGTKFNSKGEVEIDEFGRKTSLKEKDAMIAIKLEEREKEEKGQEK